MPKKFWNSERDEVVVRMYRDEVKPAREIAESIGTSKQAVMIRLSVLGVKRGRGHLTGPSEGRSRFGLTEIWLRKRYCDELATVDEIAAEVGCSVPNVRKRLKDWGIRRGRALFQSGKVDVWNKGLTAADDERIRRLSEERMGDGNPMAGRPAWNKGLSESDDPRIAAMAETLRASPMTAERRQKMSEAKLGKRGESANNWQGGVSFVSKYVTVREGGRNVYAHRFVAELFLSRGLLSDEHVHHMDRDPKNNDPRNLIVLGNDDHTRLHAAMRNESGLDQKAWLRQNGIVFSEVWSESKKCGSA